MPKAPPFKVRRPFLWNGEKMEREAPFHLDPGDPRAGMLVRNGYISHHIPRPRQRRQGVIPEPTPIPVAAEVPDALDEGESVPSSEADNELE